MKTFAIIVATYQQNHLKGLPRLMATLANQVTTNFNVYIVHDGPSIDGTKEYIDYVKSLDLWREKNICLSYAETNTRENIWGHNCRKLGLSLIKKEDYVHYTNADNAYSKDAFKVFSEVAEMQDKINKKTHIVLANIRHSYFNYTVLPVSFKEGHCDFMNMCIKSDIAKEMGFPYSNMAGDAWLIRDIKAKYKNLNISYSNKIIGAHC